MFKGVSGCKTTDISNGKEAFELHGVKQIPVSFEAWKLKEIVFMLADEYSSHISFNPNKKTFWGDYEEEQLPAIRKLLPKWHPSD